MSIVVTENSCPKPPAARSSEWRSSTAACRSASSKRHSCLYRPKSYCSWSKSTSSPDATSNARPTNAERSTCSSTSYERRSSSTNARTNASSESSSRCRSRHSGSPNIATSTSNLTTTTRPDAWPVSSNTQLSTSNERYASTRFPNAKRHDATFQP